MSAGGAHRGDGIGCARARNVMSGAVDGLEQRRPGARRVQIGRGGETRSPRHRAGQIGEDVAEEVVGDDDVVRSVAHE